MSDKKNEFTASPAQVLAGIVSRGVEYSGKAESVQRSHRFPLHMFTHIENMARMAGVPVSVMINELLQVGMDAVWQSLPNDVAQELAKQRYETMQKKNAKPQKSEAKSQSKTDKNNTAK